MSDEADRRREWELDVEARVAKLEDVRDNGAIAKNAAAMKDTIEQWNREFEKHDLRLQAAEHNTESFLRVVKDIQDSNTLALQRLLGTGPTA
jgi:hypothetical protein